MRTPKVAPANTTKPNSILIILYLRLEYLQILWLILLPLIFRRRLRIVESEQVIMPTDVSMKLCLKCILKRIKLFISIDVRIFHQQNVNWLWQRGYLQDCYHLNYTWNYFYHIHRCFSCFLEVFQLIAILLSFCNLMDDNIFHKEVLEGASVV